MQTVGSVLRTERLRQGLTLDAISLETKISPMRLQALEADEMGRFSSPFFYKSFAMQVARQLRIDDQAITQMLDWQAASIPKPLVPGEDGRQLPRVPALDNLARRGAARWLIPTLSLFVVLVASSAVFEWRQHGAVQRNDALGSSSPSAPDTLHAPPHVPARAPSRAAALKPSVHESNPAHAVQPPVQPTGQAAQPQPAKRIVEAPVEETESAASVAPVQSQVRLELAAIENVWISVVSDGKFIYSGVLNRSESKSFSSREVARIKVGNAGGVSVMYNGRKIGLLGARGSVCTAIFTAKNFEIVEPQPHVELTQYIPGNE
jgi:cytoskeletal protein RodZ